MAMAFLSDKIRSPTPANMHDLIVAFTHAKKNARKVGYHESLMYIVVEKWDDLAKGLFEHINKSLICKRCGSKHQDALGDDLEDISAANLGQRIKNMSDMMRGVDIWNKPEGWRSTYNEVIEGLRLVQESYEERYIEAWKKHKRCPDRSGNYRGEAAHNWGIEEPWKLIRGDGAEVDLPGGFYGVLKWAGQYDERIGVYACIKVSDDFTNKEVRYYARGNKGTDRNGYTENPWLETREDDERVMVCMPLKLLKPRGYPMSQPSTPGPIELYQ